MESNRLRHSHSIIRIIGPLAEPQLSFKISFTVFIAVGRRGDALPEHNMENCIYSFSFRTLSLLSLFLSSLFTSPFCFRF